MSRLRSQPKRFCATCDLKNFTKPLTLIDPAISNTSVQSIEVQICLCVAKQNKQFVIGALY